MFLLSFLFAVLILMVNFPLDVFAKVRCTPVTDLSIDGGKARLRTDKGKASEWRDYKAVTLQKQAHAAFFLENQALLDWINRQPLSETITCLGDGHPGVWNLMANISTPGQRREILDGYHQTRKSLQARWF